ncbi:serine hydrolase domain-containing protein [Dictyobacter aurantiacus]|uniref:Beta-lactamase-related domain-containing protein n=1 Tax=Dictyobacter aurantiacus TaxID=1936993 RepID=A0A401ZL62_9CHLR|nr:serine hydrolase domain-containing protein [Dictyobacter aurantiacus]GCE07583.1 hypothetical protein KDAU_49120 [Dictyobacter aurantiacus]
MEKTKNFLDENHDVEPDAGQVALFPEISHTLAQIDELVAARFALDSAGGLTVGIVAKQGLLWAKSYGYANQEQSRQASSQTVYRIGSITKMFTALFLTQLVEKGVVRLSDPVEMYLPEMKEIQGAKDNRFSPVTFGQLATHTAGLDREPALLPQFFTGAVAEWEQTLLMALPHTKFVYEPGTCCFYSNIGYAILGVALSRACKQPYVEYVQHHILSPLGMRHTAFHLTSEIMPYLAKGYFLKQGTIDTETAEKEHQGRGYKVPNGALYTSMNDLSRFAQFLLGGQPGLLLSPHTIQEHFEHPAIQMNSALSEGYGRGFQVFRRGDMVAVGHGGAVLGYEASLFANRRSEVAVMILSNVFGRTWSMKDLCLHILSRMSDFPPHKEEVLPM